MIVCFIALYDTDHGKKNLTESDVFERQTVMIRFSFFSVYKKIK